MKTKKLTALLCIFALIACLFAGCGTTDTTPTPSETETPTETATPAASEKPKATKKPTVEVPDTWEYDYEVISEDAKTAILRTIQVPEGLNNKKVTEIVFPSTINGYTVTTIGWDVFGKVHEGGFVDDCWVTKVTIPATVTSFENDVFRTANLSEVIFEDASKVTNMSDRAFRLTDWEKMTALQNNGICVVGSVVAGIYADGDVVIPDGVTMISGRPFQDTGYGASLTSITIPASVTNIGNPKNFFDLGDSKAEDVVIKCYAGSYAETFAKDNNYKYEIIGGAATYDYAYDVIDEEAKTAVLRAIKVPEGVKNAEITEITFPSTINGYTVVGIGWDVFDGLGDDNWVTKVTVPATVTYFENDVFRQAFGCTEIIFEDVTKITRIDGMCFRNAPWEKAQANANNGMCIVNNIVTGIYVGGDVVIPDGVTALARPFRNTDAGDSVTSITVPASVTTIDRLMEKVNADAVIKVNVGSYAAQWIYKQSKVYKFEYVDIDTYTYDYAYDVVDEDAKTAVLRSIVVPEGVRNADITKIVFPRTINGYTIVGIGWNVFDGLGDDNWVKQVTVPSSVTYFENDVFRQAFGCTEIFFEKESNITRIDGLCFRNAPWEKTKAEANNGICVVNNIVTGIYAGGDVVIPDGVTAISDRPFRNTGSGDSVTSITIPESVTSISRLMSKVNADAVIKGMVTSYAKTWADANNVTFVAVTGSYEYEWTVISEENKTARLGMIKVPEGVRNQDITEIVFPGIIDGYTITTIGWDVFGGIHDGGLGDDNWVQKVTVPASITTFENDVFRQAFGCDTIIFKKEANITSISDLCFRNTKWEKAQAEANGGVCRVNKIVTGIYADGDVVIPGGTTAISGRPFLNTGYGSNVTSISIPKSVKDIVSLDKLMDSVNSDAVIKYKSNSPIADTFASSTTYKCETY